MWNLWILMFLSDKFTVQFFVFMIEVSTIGKCLAHHKTQILNLHYNLEVVSWLK